MFSNYINKPVKTFFIFYLNQEEDGVSGEGNIYTNLRTKSHCVSVLEHTNLCVT